MTGESSTRTTRLSGELDDRYEEYRDSNDMTDAEAMRSLIRSSLNNRDAIGPTDGWTSLERTLLTTAGGLAAIAGLSPLLYFAGILSWGVLLVSGVIYLGVALAIVSGVSRGFFRSRGGLGRAGKNAINPEVAD